VDIAFQIRQHAHVPNPVRQLWLKVLLAGAFWTLLGLAFASQFYFSSARFGNPVSVGWALAHSLVDWYVFAALSLPAVWLARHFAIESPYRARSAMVHVLSSVAFSFAYMVLRGSIATWQSPNASFAQSFNFLLFKTWHLNLAVYWVIIAVSHAFNYARKFRERELRAAELEKRLTEARLQALQMQLNPHFLFNTLHAISSLMHKDVEAADRMLVRLGDLLRRALESTDTQEVPLREELDFLSRYAEIEQTRFGDRLKIAMDIDTDTLDALVPNLILQPLLENAIRHGIEPHARAGQIEVTSRREADSLKLEVRDNGSGLNGHIVEGVGTSNTRARLQQLYAGRQSFELANLTDGGTAVRVTLPFHTS
jgi:two-component system, LytTR family, sensor kinase